VQPSASLDSGGNLQKLGAGVIKMDKIIKMKLQNRGIGIPNSTPVSIGTLKSKGGSSR
jgi:hypothetical protein